MLPEYLRLWGLLVIALCFWLIPACYPLKKHEQGISLGISLTATLALLHYSKRQIQEEILEQNYQLMEDELIRSELAYQTYEKEQLMQQKYLSFSPVSKFQDEFLPETAVSRQKPLKLLPEAKFQNRKPGETVSFRAETPVSGVETLRNQISEMRNAGLKQKQIIALIWKVKPGGSKAYKDAVEQYKRLTGES